MDNTFLACTLSNHPQALVLHHRRRLALSQTLLLLANQVYNDQELLLSSPQSLVMSSQRAPGTYVPMLIPRGHGYPLWVPRPHVDSPIMNRGIEIGDLGYLADDGSFVFLFNVCHDAEDEVNREGVPPGFVPLRIPDNGTLTDPERYTKNSAILSYGMKQKSISLDISAAVPSIPGALGAGLEFTSSREKGAVLVLPDGGGSHDSKHLGLFEEYGETYARSWFEYFNGPTQRRQIRSGMLYLVTGCDKCHSWANTCFSTQSGDVLLKLLASAGAGQLTGISSYTWEVQNDEPVNSYVAPRDLTNQTVFVRGYSISVRDKLSRTLGTKSVEVTMIGAMNKKPPRIGTSVPFESSTTPTTMTDLETQGHGAVMGRGAAGSFSFDDSSETEGSSYDEYSGCGGLESSEDESEFDISVMDIPYGHTELGKVDNPSALINKHILDTHPDATIALTHDDFEWIGMEDNDQNPLNVMELAKYAIDNNLVSINESETTSNAWVAIRQDTDTGVGTLTRQADIYFRGTLPKGTLSAFTETGQAESSIEVPMQRSYTGGSPVIPSSLADTPCATLGVQGVLDQLNTTLGTSHTLHIVHSSSTSTASPAPSSAASVQDQLSLLSILEDFIERNYDFGTAYALLRPVWDIGNPSNIQDELHRREGKDRERRQKALVGNRIVEPDLTPRRVWDLFSNRVVPSWVTDKRPTPISHAWVDEKDRVDVLTPINGKKWPVPIPKDADLNLIRIEMLNLGAEYAWLDVLCLRQKEEGGPREDLRVEEWRLDVPTIGSVYMDVKVVICLSGLGRPLRLKDGDLDSDQSWFRRAWTLQEDSFQRIIAGDTPDGPMHARQIDNWNYETALLTRFHKELHSLKRGEYDIFAILGDMQKRMSTNPVDRVAGLAFPLRLRMLPAYNESETLEDAWTALVNAMDTEMRACILFVYPEVGVGGKKWRPTWDQVMKQPLPEDVSLLSTHGVQHDDETDEDWFDGACIEQGYVRGFNMGSAEGHGRRGELVVKAADGILHTFKIRVTHQFPIPEDTYTLLGDMPSSYHWVIGRRLPAQRFKKVSVIMMDNVINAYRLGKISLAASSHDVLL